MFDGGQSMPLAGEERTTLIDPPESRPMDPPGKASLYVTLMPNKCICFRRTVHATGYHVHSMRTQQLILIPYVI